MTTARTYKARLLRHAEYMEGLPKAAHDQDAWVTFDSDNPNMKPPMEAAKAGWGCGTACCVVGHLPIAEPRAWEYKPVMGWDHDKGCQTTEVVGYDPRLRKEMNASTWTQGARWFGLCPRCAMDVFDADGPQTPKAAARVLRKKAEGGCEACGDYRRYHRG